MHSEQVCLLHDAQEFLLIDLTIAITISFVDHLLELFISHALAKLLGDTFQVLEGNLASLIVIEKTEGLKDLVLWVTIEDLVGHHLQEFLVLNGARAIIINIGDHLLDFFLLWLETKGTHGNLQLLGVNGSRAISIEQVKGFLDLLL